MHASKAEYRLVFGPLEFPMAKSMPCCVPRKSDLMEASVQGENFRQVRNARRQERVEDYVELISDLLRDCGEARQVDLAARIGVTQPTVAKMLGRLVEAGYVIQRPYRGVFLTPAGEELAEASRRRHQIVERFLIAVGVPEDSARRDAEGMEHYVGEDTLAAFAAFLSRQSPTL